MKNSSHYSLLLCSLPLIWSISACNPQENSSANEKTSRIDIGQVRAEIEKADKAFSQAFKDRDSVAVANFYASDGAFGSISGHEQLASTWGSMIRTAVKDSTSDLNFEISSLMSDDQYVVELGRYQMVGEGKIQNEGKYVVAWKQEDGTWKIYRDVGL